MLNINNLGRTTSFSHWKWMMVHIDLHMTCIVFESPSYGSFVGNMDGVESRKEVVDSNIETKDENFGRKKSYADIFIHGNHKRHNVKTESRHVRPIQNDDVRPNLYSSYDDVNSLSHCKLSNM